MSWWRADGDATDSVGGNNGTLVSGATFGQGKVGPGFALSGATQFIEVPNSSSLNPIGGLTLEAWVYPVIDPPSGLYIVAAKDDNNVDRQFEFVLRPVGNRLICRPAVGVPGGFKYFDGTVGIPLNAWTHLAMTYDGAALKLYVNGNLDSSMVVSGAIIVGPEPFRIGGLPTGPWYLDGFVDEVSLYSRGLTAEEIRAIYVAGDEGKCTAPTPPVIFLQPTNETAIAGENRTFTVLAGGAPPLSYQWTFNGTEVGGATGASLALTQVQLTQAGDYAAVVANALGSVTSSIATLTVNPPPLCAGPSPRLVSWWQGEGNATDAVGGNHGFAPNGVGFAAGLVGQTFTFDGNNQFLEVSNAPSLNPTNALTLEAWVYPEMDPPSGLFIVAGKDSAGSARQYQLGLRPVGNQLVFRPNIGVPSGYKYLDGTVDVPLNTWTHVAMTYDGSALKLYVNGVLDGSLAVNGAITTSSEPFRIGGLPSGPWYFTGSVDEVSLYARALSESEIELEYLVGSGGKCQEPIAPFILSQPANQAVSVGSTATFSVTAGGTVPLSYQWSFGGTIIPGATSNVYTLTNARLQNVGTYSVAVTNVGGSTTSGNALLSLIFPPATVRAQSTNAPAGGTVTVPVLLAANGNENTLAFSLSFNTSLLTYLGSTLGNGIPGGALLVDASQIGSGRLGVAVAAAPNSVLSAGTQQVVRVSFAVAPVTSGSITTIAFGDQPTVRQLTDVQFNSLMANYASGTVSIAATNFEGDVFPRTNLDKNITITDWLMMGRYAARLDYPTNASEFQRADCAPRSTFGDGAIKVTDWTQAGRYAAKLDPLTAVDGPTNEIAGPGAGPSATRLVTNAGATLLPGQSVTISLNLASQGNENALGFSVSFDPSLVSFSGAVPGSDASGAILYVNTNQVVSGRLGFALAHGPGGSFAAGTREMVRVDFVARPAVSGSFLLSFGDQPVPREISDIFAAALPVNYAGGTITVGSMVPSLRIARAGQSITLAWPLWASNFVIQAKGAFLPAVAWTNLSAAVGASNNENVVTLPSSGTAKFYRLYHP